MTMLRFSLIEATYNWIIKHRLTPHVLIDCANDSYNIPYDYIDEDDKILLDISNESVGKLSFINEKLIFDAVFGENNINVEIPVGACLELYANETKQGIYLNDLGCGIDINEGAEGVNIDPEEKKAKTKHGLHLI